MRLATEDHSGQPLLILERAVVLIHFGDHIEKADVIASLVVVDSSTTNLAALCTNALGRWAAWRAPCHARGPWEVMRA